MSKTKLMIAKDIESALYLTGELQDKLNAILNDFRESGLSFADIQTPEARLFQIVVCSQLIVSSAVEKNSPVDFLQHLVDSFEVYQLAHSIGKKAREAMDANPGVTPNVISVVPAEETEPEDIWPDDDEELIVH